MKKHIFITIVNIIVLLIGISQCMQAQNNCTTTALNKVVPSKQGSDIPLPEIQITSTGIGARGTYDDYRMLYFVHGLNGNKSAWEKARTATTDGLEDPSGNLVFPQYKVETPGIDYKLGQSSMAVASNDLRSQLLVSQDLIPVGYDPTDGILIAHSQGGLVARQTDMYYSRNQNLHERKFGGLVTVNTSNQGAQLLNNNFNSGMFMGFLRQMSEMLSAGPIAEKLHSKFFFSLLSTVFKLNSMISQVNDALIKNVGAYVIDGETPAITNEYMVGAPKLSELNTYIPVTKRANGDLKNTDIVAFYTIRDTLMFEGSVSVPRFVSFNKSTDPWTVNTENIVLTNVPVPISLATMQFFINSVNDYPTFAAQDYEAELAAKFHLMHMDYKAKVASYNHRFWPYLINHNYAGGSNINRARIRNEYKKGVEFMDKFDRLYRVTIGALEYLPDPEEATYSCVCDAPHWVSPIVTPMSNFLTDCSQIEAQYLYDPFVSCELTIGGGNPTFRWHHKDSDGVVLAESQMEIPQATFAPQYLENSTHMRARNDNHTEAMLRSVLDGDVGLFFETKKKED